jgi:hypothetical protein
LENNFFSTISYLSIRSLRMTSIMIPSLNQYLKKP